MLIENSPSSETERTTNSCCWTDLLFAFSCLNAPLPTQFNYLFPELWSNTTHTESYNSMRRSVHLSTVVWSNKHVCMLYCAWKPRCVCGARSSHTVWSCLQSGGEDEPHPSSTEPESVFSRISADGWFAFFPENDSTQREKERERAEE